MKTVIEEFITYLKTSAVKHLLIVALTMAGFIGGRSWLAEHDARMQADAAVKTAQTQISSLQAQQTQVQQAAKVQIVTLQKAAEVVQTAPQAIAAIPSVSTETLHPEALPNAPDKVSVDAVPLYQDLNACKQTSVSLDACTQTLGLQKQIDGQKDTEITALKQKPSFWHRVKTTAITLGIGAAAYAIVRH